MWQPSLVIKSNGRKFRALLQKAGLVKTLSMLSLRWGKFWVFHFRKPVQHNPVSVTMATCSMKHTCLLAGLLNLSLRLIARWVWSRDMACLFVNEVMDVETHISNITHFKFASSSRQILHTVFDSSHTAVFFNIRDFTKKKIKRWAATKYLWAKLDYSWIAIYNKMNEQLWIYKNVSTFSVY